MCGFCPRRPASLAGDDDGVGTGKDEAGPAVIETDEVRRLALGAAHLDDLAVLVRVADRVAVIEFRVPRPVAASGQGDWVVDGSARTWAGW